MFHADGSGSEFTVPDGGAEKKKKGYYRFSLVFNFHYRILEYHIIDVKRLNKDEIFI